jgi:hypothetical protein
MLPIRFRELGGPIADEWSRYRRQRGKWYKLLVTDPESGRLLMFVCSAGRSMLSAMLVTSHNMSKCAIDSKTGVTALQLKLDERGEVYTAKLAPATKAQVEVYTKCWSNLKTLLS